MFPRSLVAVRAQRAQATMSDCRLCAFHCGVDRRTGPAGACRSDASPRVFHEGIEWAGEESLIPTYVVSLSGCNMTCSFCLTGTESQDGAAGQPLDADAVAGRIEETRSGLKSVTILGGEPTIHLGGALQIAARVPRNLQLVWKTNAYASARGWKYVDGIPDVVLADAKFGNDACAQRLAGIPRYTAVLRKNLRWAGRRNRLIVRHLLMPGHEACCFEPTARWLARELPSAEFSLMTGFLPVFRTDRHPELLRTIRPGDAARARSFAASLGLRMAPWRMAPPARKRPAPPDEIWIDRCGRICVDSASGALVSVLQGLSDNLKMDG